MWQMPLQNVVARDSHWFNYLWMLSSARLTNTFCERRAVGFSTACGTLSAIEFVDKNEWSHTSSPPLLCASWRGQGEHYPLSVDLVETCAVYELC